MDNRRDRFKVIDKDSTPENSRAISKLEMNLPKLGRISVFADFCDGQGLHFFAARPVPAADQRRRQVYNAFPLNGGSDLYEIIASIPARPGKYDRYFGIKFSWRVKLAVYRLQRHLRRTDRLATESEKIIAQLRGE